MATRPPGRVRDLEVTMRRKIIAVAATGAVLAAGAAAAPALAGQSARPGDGTGSTTRSCAGPWSGEAAGPGAGRGAGMGHRGMSGGDPLAGITQGTLTGDQKAELAAVAEEEKLAHDVYAALADDTGDARFARIAVAETRHLEAVRILLARYGISDPTAGKAAGQFATATVQQQYRDLVAAGQPSLSAALAVGRRIETADLARLAGARSGVTAPDVLTVYDRLGRSSTMHLRAFGG
jgi:hypothetical protein